MSGITHQLSQRRYPLHQSRHGGTYTLGRHRYCPIMLGSRWISSNSLMQFCATCRDGSYQVNYTVANPPQPPMRPAGREPSASGLSQEVLDIMGPKVNVPGFAQGEDGEKMEWLKMVLENADGQSYPPSAGICLIVIRLHTRPLAQRAVPICLSLGSAGAGVRPGRLDQQEHLRHMSPI